MPCPCRAAKGLECVFRIWFTQCGRVWFTLDMPRPCHALTMPFFSRPRDSTAVSRWPCCGLEKNGMVGVWRGHGMASVNQTPSNCVNQMGKTHSKPLAARHGRGTAWARHGHGMLCVNRLLFYKHFFLCFRTPHRSQDLLIILSQHSQVTRPSNMNLILNSAEASLEFICGDSLPWRAFIMIWIPTTRIPGHYPATSLNLSSSLNTT